MMFSSERMNKSVLGITLITEYAKGGGGGRGADPPLPDYSPQWNDVMAKSQQAIKILGEVATDTAQIASEADWQSHQAATNLKIDSAVSLIDNALAENATIPADWFGRADKDRQGGIAELQKARSNLLAYKDSRKPTVYERLSTDINALTVRMYAQGRYLSAPTQPIPPDVAWFPGSWNYNLYQKGYTVSEIQWAVEYNGKNRLSDKYANDSFQFQLEIEKALDQAILDKQIPVKKEQENIAPDTVIFIEPPPGLPFIPDPPAPAGYYPTGPLAGIGSYRGGPYPSYIDTVYAEDGSSYPNPAAVPFGKRYSKSPWEYRSTGPVKPAVEPILPHPPGWGGSGIPPGIKKNTPEWVLYQKRKGRQSGFGFVSQAVCPPDMPIAMPGKMGIGLSYESWLRQNNLNKDSSIYSGPTNDYDHELMGQGYDMPTIHATRCMMRRAKLKPRASRGSVAVGFGQTLANDLDYVLFGNKISASQEVALTQQNENATGTLGIKLGVQPGAAIYIGSSNVGIRQKVLARRACNLPRRGMIPAANMETFGGSNN